MGIFIPKTTSKTIYSKHTDQDPQFILKDQIEKIFGKILGGKMHRTLEMQTGRSEFKLCLRHLSITMRPWANPLTSFSLSFFINKTKYQQTESQILLLIQQPRDEGLMTMINTNS